MRHLSTDELVDLSEGSRDERSVPHLVQCAECRERLTEARSLLEAARGVEVPEPSPMFWDHLSARVREAVSAEPEPRTLSWWLPQSWPHVWLSASAAVLAVGIVLATVSRFMMPAAPATVAAPPAAAVDSGSAFVDPAGAPDDPTLSLVADLTSSMEWEDASQIQVGSHEGVMDEAVGYLNASELQELQQLLKAELARPGA